MCKVLLIAGIKPEHLSKVQTLAKSAAKVMSRMDEDGLGYAAITNKGVVYGEKWLNNVDAFVMHKQPEIDQSVIKMNNTFGNMIEWDKVQAIGKVYDRFGKINPETTANTVGLIIHTRNATVGSKTIENVHPFFSINEKDQPDTALIHNGGILNHAKLTKVTSSCDSEVLLHEYLGNAMYHNPWGVEQLAKTVSGTYAVGVLSSMYDGETKEDVPYLDIFKSNKELYAAYVNELETTVFCTTSHGLEEIVKASEMTLRNLVKVKDGYLIRLNAITGERIDDIISFTLSPQYDQGWSRHHENSALKLKEIGPTTQPATTTEDVEANTVKVAKEQFERRRPALFSLPYLDPKGQLTPEEKALFATLEADNKTDHKALQLVAIALSMQA